MDDYNTYGYEIRNPGVTERLWFSKNKNTAGMATEDGKIILNPYSKLKEEQMQSVVKNEAGRLLLREKNIVPEFELTPDQKQSFVGTPYGLDEMALKHSILGRIISDDSSAGDVTQEQKEWGDWLNKELEIR